jgi:hypothetical protein
VRGQEVPAYRQVLQESSLGPDGLPVRVSEASLIAFGVRPADIPGEPAFLDYVPRDADQQLGDSLRIAQSASLMLLVVGDAAGGKSRSAAEAVRLRLPEYRLLCPRPNSLALLRELPVADIGPAVLWLDDAEHYDDPAFRDIVQWMLSSGVVVVATIRSTELEARMPGSGLSSSLGQALTDDDLW